MIDLFRNVAVIVAHPDDEVLGCGGLLLKLADMQKMSDACSICFHILYLNNGNPYRSAEMSSVADQIFAVNEILGSNSYQVHNLSSAKFDQIGMFQIVGIIEDFLKKTKATTILTHDINDLHQDHKAVHNAVLVASRFTGDNKIQNIVTFPVISSSEVNPSWKFNPNLYVDISEQVLSKIDLMKTYKHELNAMSFHRGTEGIKIWARFFGMRSNMEYAEVYNVLRMAL